MIELATKVGVSIGDPGAARHVAVVREPTTGAMLRTKGRLFVLADVEEQGAHARDLAAEAADALRDAYYYDLSAGIEVSLRRAIGEANRKAASKLRDGERIHLACVVLCRNEMYAAKVGAGEVFLVRRARLFMPGAQPGELTDYAFHVQHTRPPTLGAEAEVPVSVWREQAVPGDTLVLSPSRLVEAVGPDEVKNDVLTSHPSIAATRLHDRYLEQTRGRIAPGILVVEVAPLAAVPRVRPQPIAPAPDPDVERIAERVGARVGATAPPSPSIVERALQSIARGGVTALAHVIALLPHEKQPLPRSADVSAVRAGRRKRVTIALALLLVVASAGVGALAYQDYQDARASGNVALSLLRARQEVDAARADAAKKPPEVTSAREHLETAERFIADASTAKRVDTATLADLRSEIAALRVQLTNVVLDVKTLDPKSTPSSMDFALKDVLYVADPGASRLWRIPSQQPKDSAPLTQAGSPEGIGIPALVTTSVDRVYVMDQDMRLFRYDGSTRREILIKDRQFKQPAGIAVFSQNLYVLDRAQGQVWKYEPTNDGQYSAPAIPYLEKALGANVARSFAVNGDIWIVTDDERLLRFRRQGGAAASPLEFAIRWTGPAAKIDAVQAKEGEGHRIWVLDAAGRRVVGLALDGAEDIRVALPAELPEPTAFVSVEDLGYVITVHGTRLARTDFAR